MATSSGGAAVRTEYVLGDITAQSVDVIVNAANAALSGGGGVDGAIHRVAGPQLLEACRKLGRCPPGSAVVTGAYGLPAKYVIHAVGPVWRGGEHQEDESLASCYRAAMALAAEAGAVSIAFPAISCGAYKFPVDRAARIAIDSVASCARNNEHLKLVRFVCFDSKTLRAFERVRAHTSPV